MEETCTVSDIIVEVVLGKIEDILTKKLGLLGIGYAELSCKVNRL